MSGTKSDRKKFCEAWTYFWALAKEYNGTVSILGQGRTEEFKVDFVALSPNGDVKKIISSQTDPISVKVLNCIATLPYGSRVFDGIEKVSHTFFIGNANKEGFAVRLQQ